MNYIADITFRLTILTVLLQPPVLAAFSIKQLLNPAEKKTENKKEQDMHANATKKRAQPEQDTAEQLQAITATIDLAYIQQLIANMEEKQRETLLNDKAIFEQFIQSEADAQSVLSAAMENGLHQDENTLFLVKRSAAQMLKKVYLNNVIHEKIPVDFPSEKQVIDYYNKNSAQFVIGKRMHVWQIFLPIQTDDDKKQINKIKKKARKIVLDIKNNKIKFAAAAQEFGQQNSGYAGLFKVSQLAPAIKKTLLNLKEGELSDPIQTDNGIHIVKRGATLDEEIIPLEVATPKIKQALLAKTIKKLQQAIYEQARKTYPIPLKKEVTATWREQLKKRY